MKEKNGFALRARAQEILTGQILPFWSIRTPDQAQGGFLGQILHDGQAVPDAPKGSVLNARILWTFSAAYRALGDPVYLEMAERAYAYLMAHFRDEEHGGIYWMVDYTGKPLDPKKQIYAQAFAIYGLAEFYRITGKAESLTFAIELYELIEEHSFDPEQGGYFEAYDREWNLLEDLRLSDKDANEKKTMNTHLHVLEAYTVLYQCWPDLGLKSKLKSLTRCFLDTIIDQETHHFHLFFDESWNLRSHEWSYGHDIEGSWLLCEAAEAIGEVGLIREVREAALNLAYTALNEGIDTDGSMCNEGDANGITDTTRHWWPQAEACVGFLNAYALSGDEAFLTATHRIWAYIEGNMIDPSSGEWYFRVSKAGIPFTEDNLVGPWKCPYHNGRTCLEILYRL